MITTQEGNTVIALYDNWIKTTIHKKYGQLYRQQNRMGEFWPQKWEYHYSWDWLMPVLKNLLQDLWVDQNWQLLQEYNLVKEALLTIDINKTWSATVKAIKIINKIKGGTDDE